MNQLSGMENAKKKGKEKHENEKDDQSQTSPPVSATEAHRNRTETSTLPPAHQPSSTDQEPPTHPCFSSADQPELVQETKRLRLTHEATSRSSTSSTTKETPSPSSPDSPSSLSRTRIDISSIPPASQRPFFRHLSGLPPRPPRSPRPAVRQQTIEPMTLSSSDPAHAQAIEAALQYTCPVNAAELRMLTPEERAKYKLSYQPGARRRGRKRKRETEAGWARFTRPISGPSQLGPGQSPYDKVKKVLSEVKAWLNHMASSAPAPQNSPAHETSSSVTSSSQAPPVVPGLDESALPTTEQLRRIEAMIQRLDEYVETISKTASAQEMEDLLQAFQSSEGIAGSWAPTWYALMMKSATDFLDSLWEYFIEADLEDDEDDDDTDDSGPPASA